MGLFTTHLEEILPMPFQNGCLKAFLQLSDGKELGGFFLPSNAVYFWPRPWESTALQPPPPPGLHQVDRKPGMQKDGSAGTFGSMKSDPWFHKFLHN